jgi:outer membrane lipoprotein-sorting protein
MISGSKMRRLDGILLLGAMLLLPGQAALAFDLGELMSQLAQVRTGEARFVEQRYVSGLEQPLQSSGTLSYSAPDRIARHTLLPRPESFVVDGRRVTQQRGDRVRQISLDSVPEIAAMVAALRGTLSGDAAALQLHFQPSVAGAADQWTLTLVPLDSRVAASVRQLRLEGERGELRVVQVLLADGDRSVMNIEPAGSGKTRVETK